MHLVLVQENLSYCCSNRTLCQFGLKSALFIFISCFCNPSLFYALSSHLHSSVLLASQTDFGNKFNDIQGMFCKFATLPGRQKIGKHNGFFAVCKPLPKGVVFWSQQQPCLPQLRCQQQEKTTSFHLTSSEHWSALEVLKWTISTRRDFGKFANGMPIVEAS